MKPKIIAVCGKGGVGKTSISAMMVKCLLKDKKNRVLAIDADPAIGLATSLGFEVTKSVDMIRNDLIEQLEQKTAGDLNAIAQQLDYDLLDAIEERENLAFLAIGRPEKAGCYCQVNSVLRDLVGSLSQSFDYVIIDGEAGIEQVNRRVMESVTHLILVSDCSQKGLNVAKSIAEVAGKAIQYDKMGLLINRVRGNEIENIEIKGSLELYGTLPEDEQIRLADIKGKNLLLLDRTAAFQKVESIIQDVIT